MKPEDKPELESNASAEEDKSLRLAELPLISILPAEDFERSKKIFAKLESLKELKDEAEEQMDELEVELGTIQLRAGLKGLRYGKMCFYQRDRAGSMMLDRKLLVLNGVKAEVIAKSLTPKKGYTERVYKPVSNKPGGGGE